MKFWKKYSNYRKHENADGTFTYTIIVDNVSVEVSETTYNEYATASRKMKYIEHDIKCDRVLQNEKGKAVLDENGLPILLPERERSLDRLVEEDWDFPSNDPSPEEIVINAGESDEAELHRCIALLTDDEQALIKALFFKGLTEKSYAEMLGVKQQSVNERKLRLLKKIKNIWGQPC